LDWETDVIAMKDTEKYRQGFTEPKIEFSFDKVFELLRERKYGEQEVLHTLEVYNFASELLDLEKIGDTDVREIVMIASLIHDVGRYLKGESIRHHTDVSLKQLKDFICPADLGLGERILKCVQRHSTSSKEKPQTVEEKIVFDADHLTVFTEFGFKRWFFKAEDWGHISTVQEADRELVGLFDKAKSGNLFNLKSSSAILKQTFYSKVFNAISK